MSASPKPRPVYRNIHVTDLMNYRLPIPGIVSILHRVSGALMFLLLPLVLALLQMSLKSPESFAAMKAVFANPLVKLIVFALIWAYVHHFCAGIRYLLLDMHKGIDLQPARSSAKVVMVVSLLLTVIVWVRLW